MDYSGRGPALSISRGPALIYYYITEHLTLSETISPASANYEAPTWNVLGFVIIDRAIHCKIIDSFIYTR